MPKRSTISEDNGTVHASTERTNGINEGQLKGFVSEIEAELDKINVIMKAAQENCQPHVDQIKAIKKGAAEAGIPKKPLAAKIRERGLKKKAETCRETLSEEQQEIFDQISAKLGDLPLFQKLENPN